MTKVKQTYMKRRSLLLKNTPRVMFLILFDDKSL